MVNTDEDGLTVKYVNIIKDMHNRVVANIRYYDNTMT